MLPGEEEHIKALMWLVREGWATWKDRAELQNYKQVYPEFFQISDSESEAATIEKLKTSIEYVKESK